MTLRQNSNLNIESITPFEPPNAFLRRLPATPAISETVNRSREEIGAILNGEDDRMVMLVGPCSIHDETAGIEYAQRLAKLADRLNDRIAIVMRVYFEKPRTTIGWKGFINDPHMNGTFDVSHGLARARQFMLDVVDMGLPIATEWLDPITPQYLADVVSWGAIGARTVESQTHRQLASGLSMPIGFKNGTGGTIQIAVDALLAARTQHVFFGVDGDGRSSIVKTSGNPAGHIVLRGGKTGPNYDAESVDSAIEALRASGENPNVVIDCSHANSNKDHNLQPVAFRDVMAQRSAGNRHIVGMMLESHLFEGAQSVPADPSQLRYGVSITDACVGWDTTKDLLTEAWEGLGAKAGALVG
jgi:3-deoxy-7-phosphoheptulonate synthase